MPQDESVASSLFSLLLRQELEEASIAYSDLHRLLPALESELSAICFLAQLKVYRAVKGMKVKSSSQAARLQEYILASYALRADLTRSTIRSLRRSTGALFTPIKSGRFLLNRSAPAELRYFWDIDLMIRRADTDAALDALFNAGFFSGGPDPENPRVTLHFDARRHRKELDNHPEAHFVICHELRSPGFEELRKEVLQFAPTRLAELSWFYVDIESRLLSRTLVDLTFEEEYSSCPKRGTHFDRFVAEACVDLSVDLAEGKLPGLHQLVYLAAKSIQQRRVSAATRKRLENFFELPDSANFSPFRLGESLRERLSSSVLNVANTTIRDLNKAST